MTIAWADFTSVSWYGHIFNFVNNAIRYKENWWCISARFFLLRKVYWAATLLTKDSQRICILFLLQTSPTFFFPPNYAYFSYSFSRLFEFLTKFLVLGEDILPRSTLRLRPCVQFKNISMMIGTVQFNVLPLPCWQEHPNMYIGVCTHMWLSITTARKVGKCDFEIQAKMFVKFVLV